METIKKPYISVVIPLYNKEKSITMTLNSVLAQTYTDYEIIVVDDGSTDNSLNVAERIRELDSDKIRVIHKENGGVSSARNRGVIEAKGEYVTFLDGDDIWHPDFLKEMVRLIHDYPHKSIYGLECQYVYSDEIPKDDRDDYYRGELHWDRTTMIPSGSSSCVDRNDIIAAGMFDERMTHGEDVDMWWRLILLHGGAGYAKPFSYYRTHAENRAMSKRIPMEKYLPYYIDKYDEARASNAEFRRFFDEQMIYRLYPYLFSKKYKAEARRIARKFDYSQLKWSMHFRMLCPKTYYYMQKYFRK